MALLCETDAPADHAPIDSICTWWMAQMGYARSSSGGVGVEPTVALVNSFSTASAVCRLHDGDGRGVPEYVAAHRNACTGTGIRVGFFWPQAGLSRTLGRPGSLALHGPDGSMEGRELLLESVPQVTRPAGRQVRFFRLPGKRRAARGNGGIRSTGDACEPPTGSGWRSQSPRASRIPVIENLRAGALRAASNLNSQAPCEVLIEILERAARSH